MSFHRNFRTTTAEAWHVKSGKTAYIDTATVTGTVAGSAYTPALMQYNGSTGYYNVSLTSSGNKVTAVLRFNVAAFSGGGTQRLVDYRGPSSRFRCLINAYANDFATVGRRSKISVVSQNSAGTTIALLFSTTALCDGTNHGLFYEFDGDVGTASFRADGSSADDTGYGERVAPTAGTLDSGASSSLYIGRLNTGGDYYSGQLGHIGIRDAGGRTWSDFQQVDGSPKNIESTLSTVWGGTPAVWNPHGQLDNNLGGAGNMTRNGLIVVGNGGST